MKIKSLVQELVKIAPNIYNDDNERVYYRGEACDYKDNKLLPRIFRSHPEIQNSTEQKEYERALRHRPEEFGNNMSKLDILSKMQHFGLATRLLDFTTNPLVALYFACQEDNDGFIYLVLGKHKGDIEENNTISLYDNHKIIMISNLAMIPEEDLCLYEKVLKQMKSIYDSKILLCPNPDYFSTLEEKNHGRSHPDSVLNTLSPEDYIKFQNIQLRLSSSTIKEYPLFVNHEIYPIEIFSSYFVKPVFTN